MKFFPPVSGDFISSHKKPGMYRIIGTIILSAIAMLRTADWTAYASEAGEKDRYGVTTLSVNYMREAPDFTAELGNQALMGTPVEITGEEGYWRQIKSPDPYTAWCVDLGIREMTAGALKEYIAAEKVICTADYGKVLARPSGRSEKICDIVAGDLMLLGRKTSGRFYNVILPSGESGYVRKKDAMIFSKWARKCDPTADNLIETALGFLGVPYLWGGTSIKGVDCSGLVRMVWFMNGILLPRNASQQAMTGLPAGPGLDSLEKGDLVFFGSPAVKDASGNIIAKEKVTHVGIYIGNGRFIHASRLVRINSLIPGTPDYYENAGRMIKARRIIGSGEAEGAVRITDSPAYFPQD